MKSFYILFILLIQAFAFSQTATNVLDNGDFHECNQDWEIFGDFTYACGDDFYTHYNFSYGYGYNLQINHAYGVLKQDVVFPNNITDVELELYHKITTEEIDNNVAYDKLFINLISDSQNYEVDVLSNEDNSSSYIHKVYNIPSNLFNNETVTLEFIIDNDGLKPTRFRVDDISLNVTTDNSSSDLPDLQALNLVLESDNVEVGEVINISCDVILVAGTDCDSSKLRYYFSNDVTFSSDDEILGSDNVNSLDTGESDNEDKNITIPNVSEGVYYILFVADADEEIDESNENNNVTAIQIIVTNTTTAYGTLKTILSPSQAVNNGAQWRVDSGTWLDHNQTITLETGTYTVEYKTIYGYSTPNIDTVTISENENEFVYGNYTEIYNNTEGSLTIDLSPLQATVNGAQWRIDNGSWNNSNKTVTLQTGNYSISYKSITGFTAPNSETITISDNDNVNLSRSYQEILPTPLISIKYPRGAGTYYGVEQYYDDAYVAGVKIRILAGLEYVTTNSNIELWYSLNNGNTWSFAQNFQGGYSNGSSVLDVDWYCSSSIDSENVKIKLITESNGQTVEAVNNGVFEIHPSNKFEDEGFRDIGESELLNPFPELNSILNNWDTTNVEGDGGHQCMDYYSLDYVVKNVGIVSISNTCNQTFYSPLSGKVIKVDKDLAPNCYGDSGPNSGSGNQVIIQSRIDKTKAFRILHLNHVYVTEGEIVDVGDSLGAIGSTGENTTGAHAHTSLYKNIYVSSNFNENTNYLLRFMDYLMDDNSVVNFNISNCNNLKNYHSAPFDFLNSNSSNRVASSIVSSDLENSRYTVFIPEVNVQPNIQVLNMSGLEVKTINNVNMSSTTDGSISTIQINSVASGIYILKVITENHIYSHKIIKSK